jgi:RNA polymerase sigma-70 factor (ECF subfamily)
LCGLKKLSQIETGRRLRDVNADSEPIAEARIKPAAGCDFDGAFRAHYGFVALTITSIVHDAARAEDLTVEVFWKLWLRPKVLNSNVRGWLYRTAVRMALDDLRRRSRREKYERFFSLFRAVRRPDEVHESNESRRRVANVLASLKTRDAELLLLRNDGRTYDEIAEILDLNAASVGTLLSRAQQAFRKEYIKRYGDI